MYEYRDETPNQKSQEAYPPIEKVAPYMFEEYHAMHIAKHNLEQAKQMYELTQQQWDELGS